MDQAPYLPSEDTYFFMDHIRCGELVLEIGTGAGEVAIHCAKLGSTVTATDINDKSLKLAKSNAGKLKIKFIKSDLFENVSGKFDTILFNPPYLPGEYKEDPAIYGGESGSEIIDRFLADAKKYLKPEGEIYIILSSYNDIEMLIKKHNYYSFEKLATLNLAFHQIFCYKLKKTKSHNYITNNNEHT
ncbi:MAG: methyltransferase [Thermoplasmata archaeon]